MKVLLVEDDRKVAGFIEQGLREEGYVVDAAADGYLAKPFRFEELLARVRALSRRGGAERLEVLRFGGIALDRISHTATAGQHKLDLTAKEFQLLEYFLLHPEEVIRRTTLL